MTNEIKIDERKSLENIDYMGKILRDREFYNCKQKGIAQAYEL